jgi:hypothetical protein
MRNLNDPPDAPEWIWPAPPPAEPTIGEHIELGEN